MEQPLQYYSLLQLQELLRDLVAACPMSRNVWIVAELSDVTERGGHCYMELIQKDGATGATLAKVRGTIWANRWRDIRARFMAATGRNFAAGLKLMLCVSANYHPVYGMSLNISDVNPSFTMGERQRLRREILERLKREGVLDLNKQLTLPKPTQRIAVISARGAAGYGDFMNQLLHNDRRLKFTVRLFQSVMQGPQTAASVIGSLNRIAEEQEQWDCVCIIRGGGASTDLDGFDDYELAANVAQFPLPVIVGIGHERDTTVLDYIACQRVKTPTAAAELLVGLGEQELDMLHRCAATLLQNVTDTISGAHQQLSYISGTLPMAATGATARAEKRLANAAMTLSSIGVSRLQPLQARLDRLADALVAADKLALHTAVMRLDKDGTLLAALGPAATLARGFSITRINGAAVTDPTQVKSGDIVTTQLSKGTITSTVN